MDLKKCKYCDFLSIDGITTDGETFYENAEEFHLRKYQDGTHDLICVGDYEYEYSVSVFYCPWCGRPLITNYRHAD